jgi:hypothetical protein
VIVSGQPQTRRRRRRTAPQGDEESLYDPGMNDLPPVLSHPLIKNSPTQIGIQFVQVGNDASATRALKELDDDLLKENDIRVS